MRIQIIQDIIDVLRFKLTINDIYLRMVNFYHFKYLGNDVLKIARILKCKIISYDDKRNEITVVKNNIIFIVNIKYPFIAYEIFAYEIYKISNSLLNKKYTVLDIGANKGYASLYFANEKWCEKVYGFELIPVVADCAEKNFLLNKELNKKIKLFHYGLGNKDGSMIAQYLSHRDGISSLNQNFLKNYAPKEKTVPLECFIKKASSVLKQIIKDENIILKIDVEGAEYEIFQDLIDNYPNIFEKVDLIIGETHLGFDKFFDMVKNFGYKIYFKEEHKNGTCPFILKKG